ncbi:hypothetical protein BH20CHL4_BH20CHL4_12250 [soil metagenome]
MDLSLLATKIQIPPQPLRLVQRDRLVDALERGVPHHRLVLVSALAGYGKSTLLSHWAHETRMRVAWLTISDEDNNVERLLRYFVAAWEAFEPDIRSSPLGILLESIGPDVDTA